MAKRYTLEEIIEKLSQSMEMHETRVTARSEFSALSPSQIHYLDTILHLGSPTLSDLARALRLSKPSITVIIDKLHAAGYVEKVRSDADRRTSHVHLTKKGRRIAKLHDDIHRGYARYFRRALSGRELEELLSLLGKVVAELER